MRATRSSTAVVLVIVLLTLAGCGDGGGGDKDSANGGGPTTLFADDFSGSLGAKWINASGTNGATATSGDPDPLGSAPHGNPSPGLWLQGDSYGSAGGYGGSVRSSATFPSAGITFAADARYDSGPWSAAGNFMTIGLYDVNTNAMKAAALILPTTVRYWVYQGNALREVTNSAPNGDSFHRFTLTIDQAGNSTWRRDGALQLSYPGFPSRTLYIRITGPGATDSVPGIGHADNVLVTTP